MKFSTKRKVALVAANLIPFLTIGLGTFLICSGTLLTPAICITYFLIPTVVITLFWRLIGSGWKTWLKSILCVGILLIYIPVMGFAILLGTYHSASQYRGSQAMEQYVSASTEVPSLPNPDALGAPQSMTYQYYETSALIFLTESHTLLCRYTPEAYDAQVAALETDWVFRTEPFTAYNAPTPEAFTLDGFHFRFLSPEEESYELWFPKYVALVGTNDHTHEIVWLYWNDIDLDYMGKDPADFLSSCCGWNHLLK